MRFLARSKHIYSPGCSPAKVEYNLQQQNEILQNGVLTEPVGDTVNKNFLTSTFYTSQYRLRFLFTRTAPERIFHNKSYKNKQFLCSLFPCFCVLFRLAASLPLAGWPLTTRASDVTQTRRALPSSPSPLLEGLWRRRRGLLFKPFILVLHILFHACVLLLSPDTCTRISLFGC